MKAYIFAKNSLNLNVVGTLPTFQSYYLNPRSIWSFGVYLMHTINRCILLKKECPGTQQHEGAVHSSVLAARLFDMYVK